MINPEPMLVTDEAPLERLQADTPPPGLRLFRMSVRRYHALLASDILTSDDRVELLEGWLVEKISKNPPHAFANDTLRDLFQERLPSGYFITTQNPITLAESEPEPDLAVVRGQRRSFAKRHPSAQDVALVVEVAESSLLQDRTLKARIYARAGFPVYWLVNLVEGQIEVYSTPTDDQYQAHAVYDAGASVSIVIDGSEASQREVNAVLSA